jgi:hypothetical protein
MRNWPGRKSLARSTDRIALRALDRPMKTTALIFAFFLGSHAPVAAQSAEEAIAMFLFGRPNPESMSGLGISGIALKAGPMKIAQIGPCKYRVSDPESFEEIDFNQVGEIRHSIVPSYPHTLELILDGYSEEVIARKVRKVVLVQIMGTPAAVCGKKECTSKRAFNFDDTDQIDRAKRAARFFREQICKGRVF